MSIEVIRLHYKHRKNSLYCIVSR